MNHKEADRRIVQSDRLRVIGFTRNEAEQLRRISNTLRRWYELECGNSNDFASWAIERDQETDKPYRVTYPHNNGTARSEVIADREYGAIRRLDKIMAAHNFNIASGYPFLTYYIQTDPRGIALWIIRPGDVPEGKTADCCYTNGIGVY